MNTIDTQSLISRGISLMSNPWIALLVILGGITYASMLFKESTRNIALGVLVFASMCAPATDFMDKWMQPPFPLDQLVLHARPITASLLIIGTICLYFKSRNNTPSIISKSCTILLTLQLLLCVRAATAGFAGEAFLRSIAYLATFFTFAVFINKVIDQKSKTMDAIWPLFYAFCIYILVTTVFLFTNRSMGMENGRWFGITGNPNHNAMLVAIFLPSALGIATDKSTSKRWRQIAITIAALSILPLMLSGSRGGILTATVAIIALYRTVLGKLAFVSIPIIATGYITYTLFQDETSSMDRLTEVNTDTRLYVWQNMLADWLKNPIFGNPGSTRIAENAYLGTLQRLGIIGGIVLIALATSYATNMIKSIRIQKHKGSQDAAANIAIAGLAAIAFNSMFEATFFSNLNQTVFAIYLYSVALHKSNTFGDHPTHTIHTQPA